MTPAIAAAQYNSNLGHDFTLADAYDPEYMDEEAAENETAKRQALNQAMADWFGM
jgi:hypothetical protein